MALAKAISVNDTGVEAGYWRIAAFNIDFLVNKTTITLAGYVSLEARNEGKKPIMLKTVVWEGSNNPITPTVVQAGQAFTVGYTKLVAPETRPFMPANPFEGATIV